MGLSVKNVSKTYNKDQGKVLDNLSLEIAKGEIISVIGPNGSGKSTLLSLMSGLLTPDEGQILLNNHRVYGPEKNLVPGHEEIKLVFQDYGLKPAMTIMENIRYQLLAFKEEYRKTRINKIIEICQLGELKDRKPRELSGGQQQRVALANALATDPEVLLMDEPFSNLDPFTKVEIIGEVRRISKETDTTVVIVTHDALDALSLADKIAFLDNGRILQYDAPKTFYHHPVSMKIGQTLGYLSVISDYTKKLLKASSEKNIAIRPEYVIPHSDGVELSVIETVWKGHFKLVFLDQKSNFPLISIVSPSTNVGDSMKIKIDFDQLIYF